MNAKLQKIIDFIHQKNDFSEEETKVILKWIKELDKEMEISAFKLDRTEKAKRTTAILLEETIEELEQKRKAVETQNRELEIEAALERVRATSMAMHFSKDLEQVVAVISSELDKLKLHSIRCGIGIIHPENKTADVWTTTQKNTGYEVNVAGNESMDIHPVLQGAFNAWEKQEDFHYTFSIKDLEKYHKAINDAHFHLPHINQNQKQYYFATFFPSGGLYAFSQEPFKDDKVGILKRFAGTFNQAYTRFLDLKNAEEQAHEANIIAALERVRSLALGMRMSEEVGQVSDCFFAELNKLTIPITGCSIVVVDDEKDLMEIWRARSNVSIKPFSRSSYSQALQIMKNEVPEWFAKFHHLLKQKNGFLSRRLTGSDRLQLLNIVAKQHNYSAQEKASFIQNVPEQVVTSILFFSIGYVAVITEVDLPPIDVKIIRRFADVFDFAYTRFLDLKKAEDQAKVALKQASLDRVRVEIASMRTSTDLNRITPVIWKELLALKVPFIRCGVFIIDEKNEITHVYLSTPDGRALGVLNLEFNINSLIKNTVEHWRNKRMFKTHWSQQDFINWTKFMMELGHVKNIKTYQGADAAPESLHLHFVPFKQGMLYVGDVNDLNHENTEVVKLLAEVFSVAYARYEDFKSLEDALAELKETQSQLIQSEKMASLGELTAGIAHEIQNPLNFVNNFSEISAELMDELKEEIKNGDLDETIAIADDIKQNLEKINHHGKRADGIVKGMLQHSRSKSGEKELTDINQLADEYLRLSYHGIRAKDKSFNADYTLALDDKLPKINVVPQDFGRVLLNLINNAFYAVDEKARKAVDDYKPMVTVSTRLKENSAIITVADNGNGIPENIKEKIFQPFFTTKPTGSGTGLGLSLSYDIVKAHGGELILHSKETKGSEFIIQMPKS